ncbi:MAG: phosphoribosylglycinamide formyltransferase [Chitinispirillia bacterium]|nr:phosphoribosylglycinamide formyltransferase [Chitinispirillia bacterium]MCL2241847.1 phosphoribosylglycinamide formyltransferase [Chitinispirillia bacterium]
MRCTVFASGGGSNFQALLDKRASGDLHVDFVLLAGNNSGAKAFGRARDNGINTLHIAPSHFNDEAAYAKRLGDALTEVNTELVILAGYMRKLPPSIVREYRNKIINIHPGLLPAFGGKGMYGMNVHRAVLDYGAKLSGVTVHFVDEEYDHGPVILQKAVPVLDGDDENTLAARVLEAEHDSYWRAIEALASGKIRVDGRKVVWTSQT